MTIQTRIWIIAVLAALIGVYIWLSLPPSVPKRGPLVTPKGMTQKILLAKWDELKDAACKPALGKPDAPWTLIEIGDFQCPQCQMVHKSVMQTVEDSNGRLNLYFVNWPLPQHHNGKRAAVAVLAAERQGKFWKM